MQRHFLTPTPRFGRKGNRLPIGYQQRSPYYWWWAYLRRSGEYLATCASGGAGKLSSLYADFGDVRDDDFHKWWTGGERGAALFAEQPLAVRFEELSTPNQWQAGWRQTDVVVVAVPLAMSKRALKGAFAKLLDARHVGKRGRPSVAARHAVSTAKYKLERNYDINHLRLALDAYDVWVSNQSKSRTERLTLWEIGSTLKINRAAIKKAESGSDDEKLEGRNVLGATVRRYVKQAQAMIENAGLGRFPVH
jgi:hypothetical protein